MALSRKRSFVRLANFTPSPAEYNTAEYEKEVLQTGGRSEALLDEALTLEAQLLGISLDHQSICASPTSTDSSNHARTGSTDSRRSNSTALTSTFSNDQIEGPRHAHMRKLSASYRKSLSLSEYDQYLPQIAAQAEKNIDTPIPPKPAAPSLFSVSTRKSYYSIRDGFKARFRLRRNKTGSSNNSNQCICCREDSKKLKALHILPCQHNYCEPCLRVLVSQASVDESKMPPRCCSRAIPGTIIRGILNREEQNKFMEAVWQFSTPWEARVFCPDMACGEFIPIRTKIDPKRPFEVVCRKCQTKACSLCKCAAHSVGQGCPADWELEAVLQGGQKSGWRRCYKCMSLVELAHGSTHITCRCKAQLCYICGAVWDPIIGCPNYCNGDEEIERIRQQEEARVAILETEKLAREEAEKIASVERLAAEKHTQNSQRLKDLRTQQIEERDRFCAFERKMKWIMWTRHGQAKARILDKYDELHTKTKERHVRITNQLEDRQVCAEMELRDSLSWIEKSSAVRLRHMEAYCEGMGRSMNGHPTRTVTERDLRELGQQYNIRDNLERLHQCKINVMRDKQAKQMENLMIAQETELDELGARRTRGLETLADSFNKEEEVFFTLFADRKNRMSKRWLLVEEIERKKLEIEKGFVYAPLETLEWPISESNENGVLADVAE